MAAGTFEGEPYIYLMNADEAGKLIQKDYPSDWDVT